MNNLSYKNPPFNEGDIVSHKTNRKAIGLLVERVNLVKRPEGSYWRIIAYNDRYAVVNSDASNFNKG